MLFCEFQRGPILHRVNTLNKVQPVTLETAERQLMVIETVSAGKTNYKVTIINYDMKTWFFRFNVFGHCVSITITKPIYLYSSSCTHTAQGSTDKDWWYVDLEANYSIGYVRITTRDGYQNNGMLNTELLYIRLQIIGSHSFD